MGLRRRGAWVLLLLLTGASRVSGQGIGEAVPLAAPRLSSEMSVEQALQQRRSVRTYAGTPLALQDVAQLLWAAQGVTGAQGQRTAPSAGAMRPLEVHLVVGEVAGLAPGVYRYEPGVHRLVRTRAGDVRAALAAAALGQAAVRQAPAVLVLAGVHARTAARYGDRAPRYVQIEAGHAAQNVALQATALGLAGVLVGAFDDPKVAAVLGLPGGQLPLALMPVGHPAGRVDEPPQRPGSPRR